MESSQARRAGQTMAMDNNGSGKLKDLLERLLALRITDQERVRFADDDLNIFSDDVSGRKPLQVAAALAIFFHIILLIIIIPSFGSSEIDLTREVTMVKALARPAAERGSEGRPQAAPPKPEQVVPKPTPKFVPIPDPTPNQPDPVVKREIDEIPKIVQELSVDLNIGDITAPPGPPGQGGVGNAPLKGGGLSGEPGSGVGTGGGGVYKFGDGVSEPKVLVESKPAYTDEAIKAKAQGVVWLKAIIRKDGRADSFQVLRPLGYGLEESAIQDIASKWVFQPAYKDGRPVDFELTIEVVFSLR